MARLQQAQTVSRALGFTYRHTGSLLAQESGESILARLRALQPLPLASTGAAAVLGTVPTPPVTISQAQRVYLEEIAASEIRGKSRNQRAHWTALKQRAVDNFIAEVGDLALNAIGRDEARKFYDFWRKRIAPKTGKPTHSANSGNRDIGSLRVLWSAFHRHIGQDDIKNPFDGLSFKDASTRTRPPFSVRWLRDKILAPGALAGLNAEARGIVLALIETGCRPSELCNLRPEQIVLDHAVPHIDIRAVADPDAPREIKTRSSTRRIPLVGVALEVFKRHPNGFPRYSDRGDSLSGALNKFFKENNLFETPSHKIYSFRHAFEDRMKVAGLDTELRMILMGHSNDRPAYGQGGSMEWRQAELQKIALPFRREIV
nr:site-specific integrase [Rhizobium sp. ACO-34A]